MHIVVRLSQEQSEPWILEEQRRRSQIQKATFWAMIGGEVAFVAGFLISSLVAMAASFGFCVAMKIIGMKAGRVPHGI